eukprot:Skav213941  [mRNA]  locus=scaffold2679:338399:339295:- [translate_table: standard]
MLIKCLPAAYHAKLRFFQQLVVPLASFGWGGRLPPKSDCNAIFNKLTHALGCNKVASPLLRACVYGGTVHLWPVVVQRLCGRICRLRQQSPTIQWSNLYGAPAGTLRRALKDDGWLEEGPWSWKHRISDLRLSVPAERNDAALSLGKHNIRQAWKSNALAKWAGGNRHEARQWEAEAEVIHSACQQLDWEWLRASLQVGDAAGRGRLVSPAWLANAPSATHSGARDFCDETLATWEHLCWNCEGIPGGTHARPARPAHYLSARMRWALKSQSEPERRRVLQWLAMVQEALWACRHPGS